MFACRPFHMVHIAMPSRSFVKGDATRSRNALHCDAQMNTKGYDEDSAAVRANAEKGPLAERARQHTR